MTIADSLALLHSTKTAIKAAIEDKGVTVGAAPFADYPAKIAEISGGGGGGGGSTPLEWSQAYYDAVYAAGPGSWSRPEWRTLPSMTDTDQKFIGLHAVYPEDGNFCALTAAGAYTVDWGDGTTTDHATGTQADKLFDYNSAALAGTDAPVTFTASTSTVNRTAHGFTNGKTVTFWNIAGTTGVVNGQVYFVINATADTFQVSATAGGSALTLTNDGTASLTRYKQAVVVVTPQAGQNLTSLNLNIKNTTTGLQTYASGWLDILVSGPSLTTLTISASTINVRHRYLEQAQLISSNNIESFASCFSSCSELVSVPVWVVRTTGSVDMGSMFSGCSSLQTVPLFNTQAVTNMSFMFQSCPSLQTVPLFNTQAVTNMSVMFSGCSSLQTVPLFNTQAVTSMNNMFSGCSSLQTVPLFNTQAVTNMNSMFQNCLSLQTVPLFNIRTTGSVDMGSMFSGCSSLQTVPLFNTQAVTTMALMFQNCPSLQTVPLFNTQAVTNMSYMFNNCPSLQTVPLFNTQAVTNMNNMFRSCPSLQTVPLFNTQAVTNMSAMFNNCPSLQTVPLFNTQAVTNMSAMFNNCPSLQTVPALNTTAVTSGADFSSMFATCNSLSRIQAKDFRFTFSVANCKLSAAALNEIYTNLPTVTGQTITVTGNYGTTDDNPTIATAKGWSVTG